MAEWAFVGTTHALQSPLPPRPSLAVVASVAAQHHDVLVVAMLLGGLVSNLQGINGNETTLAPQLATIAYIGAAVSASLALGLAIGPHRDVALVVMVALLVSGSAGRRFGQRGAVTGLLLFIGYFYGFFLSSAFGVAAAAWLAAEVGVATAAAVAVRLALFRPSATRDLRLAMTSYGARVRIVLDLAARLVVGSDRATRRKTQRWLVRLGESALIVDGQLARGATSQARAIAIHRTAFDVEVAVSNLARFAEMLGAPDAGSEGRAALHQALVRLAAGDLAGARAAAADLRAGAPGPAPPDDERARTRWFLLHRAANAVDAMAVALASWPEGPEGPEAPAVELPGAPRGNENETVTAAAEATGGTPPPLFSPAVTLRGGLLPGSADVSVEASILPGARVRLAPYARTAAQMAVAVSLAIVAGDALDAQRFYWAVVAALLALVGTNTVAEQLRKAAYRVAGTLAGIVVGTALVDAVGHHSVWSLVTTVVVLWVGVVFMRANYAVLAMAVTTSLSQAYLSLGEFSNGLLWERLAETAVGAGAAMITVLVVVPLRTRRVLDVALANLVRSVTALAEEATVVLAGGDDSGLWGAGRAVDAAFQALVATAQPLRLVGWTDSSDRVSRQIAAATAARNYARNLVADAHGSPAADPRSLEAGRAVLSQSAGRLVARLRGEPATPTYLRSAALFADAAGPDSSSTVSLAVRDLVLLDNALAALAAASGFAVERLDPEELVRHPAPGMPGHDPDGAAGPKT